MSRKRVHDTLAMIICANRIFRKSWAGLLGRFFCSMLENRGDTSVIEKLNFENNNNDSIILISEMTELKFSKVGLGHWDVFLLDVPSYSVFLFFVLRWVPPIFAGFYFGCVTHEWAGRFNYHNIIFDQNPVSRFSMAPVIVIGFIFLSFTEKKI